MNHPITVWCVITGILLFVFIFRAAERHIAAFRKRNGTHAHFLEIGKEKDIFYIPGDIDDDDDFEDL